MKKLLRLDKYLADMGNGTRTEVKGYIRKGRVTLNGDIVKTPDIKVNVAKDEVFLDQRRVSYITSEYFMLNKPSGVVSAREDNHCTTVVDLIEESSRKDLFPVGRLDKDTEGLLVITNDGALTHRLLSPKKHVSKVYFAKVEGHVTEEIKEAFKEGIQVDSEFKAMPADLEILTEGDISEVRLKIYEGKFHQVKRMFEAVDMEVLYLKRISMGKLSLDESLEVGEYRRLTDDEIHLLNES